jgi:hypothetical protein
MAMCVSNRQVPGAKIEQGRLLAIASFLDPDAVYPDIIE